MNLTIKNILTFISILISILVIFLITPTIGVILLMFVFFFRTAFASTIVNTPCQNLNLYFIVSYLIFYIILYWYLLVKKYN